MLDSSTGTPGGDTWSGSGTFIRWTMIDNSGNPTVLPATLIGKRFIFDPATPTVGLRNASFPVVGSDTKHVIFQADPGTIGADWGYFVEPTVFLGRISTAPAAPGTAPATSTVTGIQFAGLSAASIQLEGSADQIAACEQNASTGILTGATQLVGGTITTDSSYVDETGTAQSVGVGLRAAAPAPSFAGNVVLSRLYHVGTGGFFIDSSYNGSITDGYYGYGLVMTNCGGHGGTSLADGAFVLQAENAAFVRGPRILGPSFDALQLRGSSAYVDGADLADASNVEGGALHLTGTASSAVVNDVSSHNCDVSIHFSTHSVEQTARATVLLSVSNGLIGLYSFRTWLLLLSASAAYVAENFYDLLVSGSSGIEDALENAIFDPALSTGATSPRISKYPASYAAHAPISRFMLVAAADDGYAELASASTEAGARKVLGSINAAITSQSGHVLYGQIGYCFVDLTGGHGAAAAGDALYLSQTRAGFAQSDKPVAGVVKQVGIALAASSGSGLTKAFIASPDGGIGTDFFELNLAFNSGALAPHSNFNMLPTTAAADVSSGLNWEWECPFDTTGAEVWVNVLQFVGAGPMNVDVTQGGTPVFNGPQTITGTGLFDTTGALTVAAGQTIGININTGAGTLTAVAFTVRMRVS